MNREIKIKIWDKHTKVMSEPFELSELIFDWRVIWTDRFKGQNEIAGCDMVYLECTGMPDKNGNIVFEGDVYRDEFSIDDENGIDERIYFVCIFFKPLAAFCWVSIDEFNLNPNGDCWDKSTEYPYTFNEDEMSKISIIGNIFENPELLNS